MATSPIAIKVQNTKTCIIRNCKNPRLESFKTTKKGKTYFSYSVCHEHWMNRMRERWDALPARYVDHRGYVLIRPPDGGRRIAEHRWVMERKLGRPLRKEESVHHINGDKTDNSPDNLELWVGAIRNGQRARDITCPHCGNGYSENPIL